MSIRLAMHKRNSYTSCRNLRSAFPKMWILTTGCMPVKNYFNVVVHFPLDKKSKKITIAGIRKGMEYAIKHLLIRTDYFMVDVLECKLSGS